MHARKERVSWTQEEELAFVQMIRRRKTEFQLYSNKTDIYNDISMDFLQMGLEITVAEIKNKLDSFSAKYKRILARMETDPGAYYEWPLFEAVRDIIETICGGNYPPDNISAEILQIDVNSEIAESVSSTHVSIEGYSENESDSLTSDLLKEHKGSQSIWTPELEFTFICMWAQRQVDFASDKKHIDIFKEMSAEFEKLGLNLTPSAIKHKMYELMIKYKREKRLMRDSNLTGSKWIFYDKMNDIIENPFFHNLNDQEEDMIETPISHQSVEILHTENTKNSSPIADYRKNKHYWKPKEELALVNMFCECRAEIGKFKKYNDICRKISVELQKIGKPLTPKDIKNKIVRLAAKYSAAKKLMAQKKPVDMDWPLFKSLREMIEGDNYNLQTHDDDNLEVVSQTDIEKLITCGKIKFNTHHLHFVYTCQICEEQTDSAELFLQHTLKEHLILNDEQKQIYDSNASKSHHTKELANNSMKTNLQNEINNDDNNDNYYDNDDDNDNHDNNDNDCKQTDGEDDENDTEISSIDGTDLMPSSEQSMENTGAMETNNIESQQQLKGEPIFEVLYCNEQNPSDKMSLESESNNDMEKVNQYIIKMQRPGGLDLDDVSRGQNGYACPYCKKCFLHKYKLRVHIRNRHLGFKGYACSICDSRCKDLGNMQIHVKRHLNIKPHLCSVCGKTFTSSTELRIHTRMHNQEKPYKCTECTMTFRTSSRLAAHRRRHRNERPHGCEYCGKRFFIRKSWEHHVRTHTKERPLECSTCHATFSHNSTLRQHKLLHMNIKAYECKYCDAAFKQYAGLFGHLKRCSRKNNPNMEL